MATKLAKILTLTHTIFCLSSFGQELSGDLQTVPVADGSLYSYYKDIAYNFIVAAFCIQSAVIVYNVAKNTPKAKKTVIQLLITTAITGIIWAML